MKKRSPRNSANGMSAKRSLFSVLANQGRLDMLRALQKGEMNVTQLMKKLGISQTLASHHLKTLTDSKLVKAKRDGYFRVYSLNGVGISPLLEFVDGKKNGNGHDYRAIVDHLPAIVWLTGKDGSRVEFCNKYWTEYTGRTLEQGIKSGWMAALHPADRKKLQGRGKISDGDGTWSEVAARVRKHDGSYHRHIIRLSPLKNGNGDSEKWIGIAVATDEGAKERRGAGK